MPKTQVTRPKTRTDQLNKSMAISWLDVSYTATTYLATTTTTKSSVHCLHFCGVRARVCVVCGNLVMNISTTKRRMLDEAVLKNSHNPLEAVLSLSTIICSSSEAGGQVSKSKFAEVLTPKKISTHLRAWVVLSML